MRRTDLLGELAALAVDLEPTLVPARVSEQLGALCTAARLAFGAAAVSVAMLDGEMLRYLGAAGSGADAIVGTELPVSRGIAGYVAVTGLALAVDRPAADPRFARDVAERTGYVPDALLVAPITAPDGDVSGVLTVLDRSPGDADALAMASAFAAQAWYVVRSAVSATSTARVLLEAIVDAAASSERDLGPALRRAWRRLPPPDAEIALVAQALVSLRGLPPQRRERATEVIAAVIELANTTSRARTFE